MKSSHKNSPLPNVFSGFALALVAVVGFFTVGTMLPKQQSQEAVLGATSAVTSVTRTNSAGQRYQCKRVNCDQVERSGTFSENDDGNVCRSVRDSSGRDVCYWTSPSLPGFNTPQCDVNKSNYRTEYTTYGKLNFNLLKNTNEDSENIAYFNCSLILSPTPTRIPTPTAVAGCKKGWGQLCGEKTCSNGGRGYCISPYLCVMNGELNGKAVWKCAKKQLIGTSVGDTSTSIYVFPTVKPTNPKPTSTPTPNKNIR